MIEWRFKPNSRDDMDIDPIQGEFFTTRDIGNISNAVIREGIQNALDERNREGNIETVKVRIFLSGKKYALNHNEYLPLIKTLLPHLKAKSSGLPALPDFKNNMNFLAFEDFNTKGLEGNPEEFYVENNNDTTPHNFYYFWRNVGRSGKTDDKLGRWGLGKTVFPAASLINTFWGLTVRKSDNRKLLMGQSVLRTHNREDEKKTECGYKPYGMYGNFIENNYFALPIEQQVNIFEFEQLFRLKRNDASGLSLIIPFYSEEITLNHLAYSVIEQYFYPILEGKLEVEITEEDNTIHLSKETIKESLNKIDFQELYDAGDIKVSTKESLLKLFDFAQWTFRLENEDYYTLNALGLDKKPRWNKNVLFKEDAVLDILRDRFERGERVAFKVPLKYYPVGGKAKTCYYDAFLEKDTSLTKPENLFVRDGITISGINSIDRGLVRGLVVIHDVNLARMLGDSENPAHTEWQADSRNFKGKYVDGKEALVFIKSTLKQLFDRLQKPLEELQKDLLIDFFSIPVETKEEARQKNKPDDKPGDDELDDDEIPPMSTKVRAVLMEKIPSGLKLYKNPKAKEVPESIKIKLGYDVPRGNPVSSYQELDFDVSKAPITISAEGVYFTKKEKNILEFNIEQQSNFEITLTGFDEKRDLFLKVQ